MTRRSDPLRSALILALAVAGCATPAVHGKWLAYDAVERVSFTIENVEKDEALLRWQVESSGLDDRHGETVFVVEQSECAAWAFDLLGQSIRGGSDPRWVSIDMPYRHPLESDTIPADAFEVCHLHLRPHEWSGDSSPRFDMVYQGRVFGDFEVDPPRRNAWLPLYPFAVVGDTLLLAPVLLYAVVVAILPDLELDDFTWTRDGGVNWHRKRSDEKRDEK